MSESASKAVFLSYASQDAEAALRLCSGLRAAGVEVWFDQNELVGGDAWDAKIRRQIGECALFVPVISASTEARLEGYFRLEWKLAANRTHTMADEKAFLLPIVIDGTRDVGAKVPAEFRAVQWTRLRPSDLAEPTEDRSGYGGQTRIGSTDSLDGFCERVKILLAGEVAPVSNRRSGKAEVSPTRQRPARLSRRWVVPTLIGGALVFTLAVMQPWRNGPKAAPPSKAPTTPLSEAAQLAKRARELYVKAGFSRDDLVAAEDLARRATDLESTLAAAWGVRAGVQASYLLRNWDLSDKRRQDAQAMANRALALDPDTIEALLALGQVMLKQGAWAQAESLFRRAASVAPSDNRTLRGLSVALDQQDRREEARDLLLEALRRQPQDVLTRYDLAARYNSEAVRTGYSSATYARAIEQLDAAIAVQPWGGALLLKANLIAGWKGDLVAMRAAVDLIPPADRVEDRAVSVAMWCGLLERKPERVIAAAALTARDYFEDALIAAPKAWMLAHAHRIAGQHNLARLDWETGERVLRGRLASQPNNFLEQLRLAVNLAWLGREDEARRELASLELIAREQGNFRAAQLLAYGYAGLGDAAKAVPYIRQALNKNVYVTHALLPLDPWCDKIRGQPEFEALLAEGRAAQEAEDTPSPRSRASLEPTNLDVKSVAVLAFANLSDDKDNEYFSDGISEELLNVLAKVPGLKVSARTSAFSFKGKGVAIPEIARQLGVAYVVEGSVRKAGNRVRITAQLIKAADGFHVWSENFDRELKDIFAVQDEIAGLIAKNLSLTLGGAVRPAQSVNPEAHRLVLEGNHFWNLRTDAGFDRAEAAYTRALALDPNFAAAHAGLANVLAVRGWYGSLMGDDVGPAFARAREEAQAALALDPSIAEPWAALGAVEFNEWKFAEAERAYQTALRLNPNYSYGHHWRAHLLMAQGRLGESLAELERAAQLDPLSLSTLVIYSLHLQYAGKYAEALAMADRALALTPYLFVPLQASRSFSLLKVGRKEDAVAAARLVARDITSRPRWWTDALAMITLREAGLGQEATELANQLIARSARGNRASPIWLAAAGRIDEAMAGLAQVRPGASAIGAPFYLEAFEPLRQHPRFSEVMSTLGYREDYERARAAWKRLQIEGTR